MPVLEDFNFIEKIYRDILSKVDNYLCNDYQPDDIQLNCKFFGNQREREMLWKLDAHILESGFSGMEYNRVFITYSGPEKLASIEFFYNNDEINCSKGGPRVLST